MKRLRLAEGLLRQAERRLKSAKFAFAERDFAYTVRQSQECVEMSLKAALRLIGVGYPKVHDVSPALKAFRERFPSWFKREVKLMAEASRVLAEYRGPSMYGIEVEMKPPEELFEEDDAKRALDYAQKVYENCRKLFERSMS